MARQMNNKTTKIKSSMCYNKGMNNGPLEPEEGVIKVD
jgi:hypothetical protein